jgi:hypothetical protein
MIAEFPRTELFPSTCVLRGCAPSINSRGAKAATASARLSKHCGVSGALLQVLIWGLRTPSHSCWDE